MSSAPLTVGLASSATSIVMSCLSFRLTAYRVLLSGDRSMSPMEIRPAGLKAVISRLGSVVLPQSALGAGTDRAGADVRVGVEVYPGATQHAGRGTRRRSPWRCGKWPRCRPGRCRRAALAWRRCRSYRYFRCRLPRKYCRFRRRGPGLVCRSRRVGGHPPPFPPRKRPPGKPRRIGWSGPLRPLT